MIRVVLTGSESTGKTELARRLAAYYGATLVPEFLRDFASAKGAPLTFEDHHAHGPIVRGQTGLEDEQRARGGSLLIQDTDLLSTVVYCRHYYGRVAEGLEDAACARRPDLYLLLEIDVPWMPDPLRDRGERREEMQQLFRDEVARSGVPVVVIRGDWEARFRAATAAIDALLASRASTR